MYPLAHRVPWEFLLELKRRFVVFGHGRGGHGAGLASGAEDEHRLTLAVAREDDKEILVETAPESELVGSIDGVNLLLQRHGAELITKLDSQYLRTSTLYLEHPRLRHLVNTGVPLLWWSLRPGADPACHILHIGDLRLG